MGPATLGFLGAALLSASLCFLASVGASAKTRTAIQFQIALIWLMPPWAGVVLLWAVWRAWKRSNWATLLRATAAIVLILALWWALKASHDLVLQEMHQIGEVLSGVQTGSTSN